MALYISFPSGREFRIDGGSDRASDSLQTDGLEGFVDLDADGDAVVGPHPTAQLSFPVNRLSSGNRLEDRELQKRIDDGDTDHQRRAHGKRTRAQTMAASLSAATSPSGP